MVNITDLPIEMISYILKYEDISIEDVYNFSSTCRNLCFKLNNCEDTVWQSKFFKRWPSLKETCLRKWRNKEIYFRKEIRERINCQKELLDYFSQLYSNYHSMDDLSTSDMKDFDALFRVEKGAHPMKYYYLEDELLNMLDERREVEDTNLTLTYYARKVLSYMKQHRLTKKWKQFVTLPAEQQVLERAVGVMMQWYQWNARVSSSYMSATLNMLMQITLEYLKGQTPGHPIFSISKDRLSFWETHNIDDNYWEGAQAEEIVNAVVTVILDRFNNSIFHEGLVWPDITFDYEKDENGLALYTYSISQIIARRFGIRCDLIWWTKPYFVLTWRESYTNIDSEGYFNISILSEADVSYIENRDTLFNVLRSTGGTWRSCVPTPIEQVLRLTTYFQSYWENKNKKRLVLEFRCLVQPQNTEFILNLARFLITYTMNFRGLSKMLTKALINATYTEKQIIRTILIILYEKTSSISQQLSNTEPKLRVRGLKYAIGMIVKFRKDGMFIPGVIYGWSFTMYKKVSLFQANQSDLNYVVQPYYKILAPNHEEIYLAQHFVRPLEETTHIENSEIGRYFSYFKTTHYIPNELLEKAYPEDAVVRNQWLEELSLPGGNHYVIIMGRELIRN